METEINKNFVTWLCCSKTKNKEKIYKTDPFFWTVLEQKISMNVLKLITLVKS